MYISVLNLPTNEYRAKWAKIKKEVLYTGLFLLRVIFILLHLQSNSPVSSKICQKWLHMYFYSKPLKKNNLPVKKLPTDVVAKRVKIKWGQIFPCIQNTEIIYSPLFYSK